VISKKEVLNIFTFVYFVYFVFKDGYITVLDILI
jgi:hypothetical protein